MATRNALATARLSYRLLKPKLYRCSLMVWSRTYDHPTPMHRSAAVTGVFIAQLPATTTSLIATRSIKDRYGVSHSGFWVPTIGGGEEGWDGYAEYDTGGACGAGLPNVFWSASSGIYDDRCAADPAIDAYRLQTARPTAEQITVYNYLAGPVTFEFDFKSAKPPAAVRLVVGLQGGNGGNPAQLAPTLPNEEFTIVFP
ncbi:MAG: hypothetical protein OEV95_12025 [Gemmatimonadota bacterium]|nr:hypothetical protein [Gemmatimonadota bacterium]